MGEKLNGAALDLPIHLDRAADEPLQWQVIAQLRAAIFDGRLAPGARLPATRALAGALGISRHVGVAAYAGLFAGGAGADLIPARGTRARSAAGRSLAAHGAGGDGGVAAEALRADRR